jgi:hypothetical protein
MTTVSPAELVAKISTALLLLNAMVAAAGPPPLSCETEEEKHDFEDHSVVQPKLSG